MADEGEHGGTICCICYEVLKPLSQNLQAISICGHVFHELCLKQWFEYCESANKNTSCPVCKQICEISEACRLYFQSLGDVPLKKLFEDLEEEKARMIQKLEDGSKCHQMNHKEIAEIMEKQVKLILACHKMLLKRVRDSGDKQVEALELILGIVKKNDPDNSQLQEALLSKIAAFKADLPSMLKILKFSSSSRRVEI